MKQILTTLTAILLGATATWADTTPGIQLVMDGSTVDIALTDIQKITYPTDGTILLTMKAKDESTQESDEMTFELSDIQRVVFADVEVNTENAIATTMADETKGYRIYTLNGLLVGSYTSDKKLGETLSTLPKGTYLVNSTARTIKIKKD